MATVGLHWDVLVGSCSIRVQLYATDTNCATSAIADTTFCVLPWQDAKSTCSTDLPLCAARRTVRKTNRVKDGMVEECTLGRRSEESVCNCLASYMRKEDIAL
jgi:hypothetical protein